VARRKSTERASASGSTPTPKAKAKAKSKPSPKAKAEAPAAGWADLTWEHLDRWAGSRSVQRGRSYQRGGRVKQLAVSADGRLLAWVMGTHRYATTISLTGSGAAPRLESSCTCPVGVSCKHAVAVVASYLDAVAAGADVPIAPEDDPRWLELEDGGFTGDEWGYEDFEEYFPDEDEDGPAPARRAPKARRGEGKAADQDWDARIETHIRSRSEQELADLVWSLALRFPELYREFKERLALLDGDVDRLVTEARREIRRVTSQEAWVDSWSGRGSLPDYEPIQRRLERLLEMGHADEVVSLGRLLIAEGLRQVGQSDDEGETGLALSRCLPVVFQAVAVSSLPWPDRLLMAIDAELEDGYGLIGDETDAVINGPASPEDWSAVADRLAGRLAGLDVPAEAGSEIDRFHRSYERNRITDWIATALGNAGRSAELEAILEAEARRTLSFERLVDFLIGRGRLDDAERWAREGISKTAEPYPGIASGLASRLLEIARSRKKWGVVAAHAAVSFFDRPSPSGFDELMKAARKAKVEPKVRAAALRFLETGVMPVRPTAPAPAAEPRSKPNSRSKSPALRRAEQARTASPSTSTATTPEAPQVIVDPDWPLPTPEYLLPLLSHARRSDPEPRPRLDVLLLMAVAAKDPDEVLRWYDRMRQEPARSPYGGGPSARSYADRVAEAVADAHPDRAIALYREALEAQLPHAQPSAYESAAGYLRKLRPLYRAVGREGEWDRLLASIRESYRNRPRFMEQLDRLDPRPIVQSARPGGRSGARRR
jgi:uncharacterized Zn finger protein